MGEAREQKAHEMGKTIGKATGSDYDWSQLTRQGLSAAQACSPKRDPPSHLPSPGTGLVARGNIPMQSHLVRTTPRARPRFLPTLEQLEDRTAPSITITRTSTPVFRTGPTVSPPHQRV